MAYGTYEVGYGKPPKHTQFKKGASSANPRGRPAGSRRLDPLTRALNKRIVVVIDGKRVRITILEVMQQKVIRMAVDGDLQAFLAIQKAWAIMAKAYAEMPPTKAELAREMREDAQRQALSARLVGLLDQQAAAGKPERPHRGPEGSSDT